MKGVLGGHSCHKKQQGCLRKQETFRWQSEAGEGHSQGTLGYEKKEVGGIKPWKSSHTVEFMVALRNWGNRGFHGLSVTRL